MDKKNCFRLYVILIYFIYLWDIGRIDYKKKKTDPENLSFFFKGFLIFALHCVRNSQVSFIRKKDCVEQKFQNLAWIWVPFFVTFLVYLQIRERFKRKVSTVFPSATNGNSTKKNSHVNMSDFAMWRQLNCSLTMNLNWKNHTRKRKPKLKSV